MMIKEGMESDCDDDCKERLSQNLKKKIKSEGQVATQEDQSSIQCYLSVSGTDSTTGLAMGKHEIILLPK